MIFIIKFSDISIFFLLRINYKLKGLKTGSNFVENSYKIVHYISLFCIKNR